MQVAGDRFRPHVEQAQQMRGAFLVEAEGLGVGEVADMLADKSLAPAREGQRRLEMAAAGEHARAVGAEVDRLGHKAARPAQKGRCAVDDLHHAVVGAHHNVAVMGDDQVGDAGEPRQRLVIADDQRLAARIGAGGDQREICACRRPPA